MALAAVGVEGVAVVGMQIVEGSQIAVVARVVAAKVAVSSGQLVRACVVGVAGADEEAFEQGVLHNRAGQTCHGHVTVQSAARKRCCANRGP